MGTNNPSDVQLSEREKTISTLAERALNAVETALAAIPIKGISQTSVAERAIVRLRDALIEQLRQSPDKNTIYRTSLERTNAALSLVVGVEYPQTPNQRTALEMARDALREAYAALSEKG